LISGSDRNNFAEVLAPQPLLAWVPSPQTPSQQGSRDQEARTDSVEQARRRGDREIANVECLLPDASFCGSNVADGALPPFSAGSHIDMQLPEGITRQYSLCNDPTETHRYLIGVLRDPATRGDRRRCMIW
jgi:hypothetical protein